MCAVVVVCVCVRYLTFWCDNDVMLIMPVTLLLLLVVLRLILIAVAIGVVFICVVGVVVDIARSVVMPLCDR